MDQLKDIRPGKHLFKVTRVTTEVFILRADTKWEAEETVKDNQYTYSPSYKEEEYKTRKQR